MLSKLKQIIQLSGCTIFFVIIVYLRLFRWGQVKTIAADLLLTSNYMRIAIIIGIIISLIVALYLQFRSLYEIESKGLFNFKFIMYMLEALENAFLMFFKRLDWIADKCGLRSEHLVKIGLFIYRIFNNFEKGKILVYLIYVVPKSIYTLIFIVDVFIFHQLYYVFMFSGLLLIPFAAKFIEKLYDFLTIHGFKNMDEMFFVRDYDTGTDITTEALFFKILEAKLTGVPCSIEKVFFVLKREHIYELAESVKNMDDAALDYDAQQTMYYSLYLHSYVPLRTFIVLYLFAKKEITSYSNILFTISYLLIWLSLLYMTL